MPNIHRFSQNVYVAGSFVVNLAAQQSAHQGGASVDTLGLPGGPFRRAELEIQATVSAGTLDASVQESADNSTWSTITGGAITQLTSTASNVVAIIDIDLAKRKRYLRAYYEPNASATGYATAAFHLYEPMNAYLRQSIAAVNV